MTKTVAEVTLAVLGAGGRMGQAVLDEGEREPRVSTMLAVFSQDAEVSQAALRWSKARVAKDAEAALDEVVSCGGAAIDFTAPEASARYARMAAKVGCPFVCGTTGLAEQEMLALREASTDCALVYAANFSLGVALLATLVERAAAFLSGEEFDAEIFEMHHREKKDAPSGTALRLGKAVERGRGQQKIGEAKGDRGGGTRARRGRLWRFAGRGCYRRASRFLCWQGRAHHVGTRVFFARAFCNGSCEGSLMGVRTKTRFLFR